jgi:hypothetical protein
MAGLMQGPQGPPQGAPQGPPVAQAVPQGPPGAQGGGFPANQEEAETFILQLVKLVNEDEEISRILKEESGGKAPSSAIMGALAAQILTMLFSKLHEQSGGEQVNQEFVVNIIRTTVKELADIADGMGLDTSVEDEQQAAKIAGDSLDDSMEELYAGGGQQAPQGQPQAPQGQLQGGQV